MKTSPCKGCEERDIGCHGFCIAYKKWKAEHDEIVLLMHDDVVAGRDMENRIRRDIWKKR